MGLLWTIVTLPFAPIRGVVAIGELIREEVEYERTDPSAIRAELEEIERRQEAGLISDEEVERAEEEIIDRLTGGGPAEGVPPGPPGPAGRGEP